MSENRESAFIWRHAVSNGRGSRSHTHLEGLLTRFIPGLRPVGSAPMSVAPAPVTADAASANRSSPHPKVSGTFEDLYRHVGLCSIYDIFLTHFGYVINVLGVMFLIGPRLVMRVIYIVTDCFGVYNCVVIS